jgi:anti-anti-sigma factor
MVRARDIAVAALDYDGSVTVRRADAISPGQGRAALACHAAESNVGDAEGFLYADAPASAALGLRRTGSERNRDGRPIMAPRENDHYLHAPGLSIGSQAGYTVATISGDLDIACVPVLRERLLGVLGPHASRVVIDLSGVTFCDASGLAVLVGVDRRARLLDGVLRLVAPAPPVTKVLRLTGLDLHFQIFDTVPAAIRVPAHPGARGAGSPRRIPTGQPDTPAASAAGSPRQAAAGDDDDVHEAVAAVLAQADAWRDADPERRLTRPLRALARAQAGADCAALTDAARSLLAGLLRHPLTHSAAVAATATELRRVLGSGRQQPAASGGGG